MEKLTFKKAFTVGFGIALGYYAAVLLHGLVTSTMAFASYHTTSGFFTTLLG